jgi:hypothetical protein
MAEERAALLRGGCQCGAVRYAIYGKPNSSDVCHCRMCQKALGNVFGAFANISLPDFAWTRGEPAIFRSSSVAERGFCRACGTPLSYRFLDSDRISVTLGSLDEPARVRPGEQVGIESRVPWLEEALRQPGKTTEEGLAGIRNFQHPDREA